MTHYRKVLISLALLAIMIPVVHANDQAVEPLRFGFLEGGKHPLHSILRGELTKQLEAVLGTEHPFIFDPYGYGNGHWNRDSCRMAAAALVENSRLDMIVTMGPWTVEDLLAAGCTKPIIALHRFDPVAEELVDSLGQPLAENLTVHIKPGRLYSDLSVMYRLLEPKKVGILYFPTGDESSTIIETATAIGEHLGFEIVSAEGFDFEGTYAHFKAYKKLYKDVDALYLPPMWGMNEVKVSQFFSMAIRDKLPTFSCEGAYVMEHGALASDAGYSWYAEALFAATKVKLIAEGATPANLPTVLQAPTGLAVNQATAAKCGVSLPLDLLASAYTIYASEDEQATYYRLADATARALHMNPDHSSRLATLGAAAGASWSPYLPQVEFEAALLHHGNGTINNQPMAIDRTSRSGRVSIQQLLFSLETIQNTRMESKARKLREAEVEQSSDDLQLAVALAYLNVLRSDEILDIQMRQRNLIDRCKEVAESRFGLADGPEVDIWRWETDRHVATEQIMMAQADMKSAQVLLNVLFNLPGETGFTLDTASFSEKRVAFDYSNLYPLIATAEDRSSLVGFLVEAGLANNPHMRQRRIHTQLDRARLNSNRASFLPEIGFQASLGFADSLANQAGFKEDRFESTFGVTLTLPLFLGGQRHTARTRLKARLESDEHLVDAAALEVMGRIRSEAERSVNALMSIPGLLRSTKLAGLTLERTMRSYEAGETSSADLAEIQRQILQVQLRTVNTRYNYLTSLAALVNAVGWSPDDGDSSFRDAFFMKLKAEYVQGP